MDAVGGFSAQRPPDSPNVCRSAFTRVAADPTHAHGVRWRHARVAAIYCLKRAKYLPTRLDHATPQYLVAISRRKDRRDAGVKLATPQLPLSEREVEHQLVERQFVA